MVKRDLGLFNTAGCCEKNKPAPEERGSSLERVGVLVIGAVIDDGDRFPLAGVAFAAEADNARQQGLLAPIQAANLDDQVAVIVGVRVVQNHQMHDRARVVRSPAEDPVTNLDGLDRERVGLVGVYSC